MNKQSALCLCYEVFKSEGLFCTPIYNAFHGDWEIRLNSTVYNSDIDKFSFRYELRFIDFSCGRYEGSKTQDFPRFYREF